MAYTDEDRRNHIREVQEYLRAISFFDKRIPQIGDGRLSVPGPRKPSPLISAPAASRKPVPWAGKHGTIS